MHGLRRAARVDDIDLRGDLVGRAEPGAAHGRDDVVGVVGREHIRRAQRQFLQRVPDPIVLPGLGEVIASGAACGMLIANDRLELLRGPIDDAGVLEHAAEHHDARAVVQGADQFGRNVTPACRAGNLRPQACAVIDQHVLLDRAGIPVVGQVRLLTHHIDEASELAVIFVQVARHWAGTVRHVLAPWRSRVMDNASLGSP